MKIVGAKELVLYCITLSLLQLTGGADSIPSCTDNEVRLVGGSGEWEGNVQICYNGKWGAVCDNDWGDHDTQVVCRQLLNYSAPIAGYQYRLQSYYGYQGAEPAVLDFVNCTGTEEQLSECNASWSTAGEEMSQPLGSCNPSKMAGVYCGYKNCNDGAVRLVHDQSGIVSIGRSEGRVEVCHENSWKNICNKQSWSKNEAKVVCKQLGFSDTNAEGFVDKENTYGPGFHPYAFSNVTCSGSEESIFKCSKSTKNLCTNSYSIAAVRCYTNTEDMSCSSNYDVRLYNAFSDDTTNNHEGVLQTCINGKWHSVCHDSAKQWSCVSQTACIQLGYKGALNYRLNAGLYYGYTEYYDDHRYDYTCTSSSATRLSHCVRRPSPSSCGYYNKTMGIVCYNGQGYGGDDKCTNGDVRLMNGTTADEGRVEYCYGNMWSPMCSLTSLTANLMCQKMGYIQFTSSLIIKREIFGRSVRMISLFDELNCSPTATHLSDCTVIHKDCGNDINRLVRNDHCPIQYGLKCYNCQDGDLRLINSTINVNNGTLEICYSNTWGLVSASNWNEHNTDVACKNLGYDGGVSDYTIDYNAVADYGNRTIHLHNVTCTGTEQNLINCNLTFAPLAATSIQDQYSYAINNNTVIGIMCGEQVEASAPPASVSIATSSIGSVIVVIASVFMTSLLVYVIAVRKAFKRRKQTAPPDGAKNPLFEEYENGRRSNAEDENDAISIDIGDIVY